MCLRATDPWLMFVAGFGLGFPCLCNELSRGGVPSLRVDRQVRIHSWFSKYLLQK